MPARLEEWFAPELDQAHIMRNETARVILANPVMWRTELIGQPARFTTPIDGSDCVSRENSDGCRAAT
jgi:hypothetical protein